MTLHSQRARLLGGVLALVIGLTLAAPPAQAAETTVAAPVAGPIAAAAIAKAEAMPVAAQVKPAPAGATTAAAEGKPFFKSTRGVIALVLMGGALGYMGYSFSHDRVKSPAR